MRKRRSTDKPLETASLLQAATASRRAWLFSLSATCGAFIVGNRLFAAEDEVKKLPSTGEEIPALAPFDRLMQRFLRENKIPGAALAVTKDSRLVYARGFGYADRATKSLVEPTSLFRIASISKPITGVAVMRLIEQGKLKLDTPVFALLKLEPKLSEGQKFDARIERITVGQLLHHTGGWDRGVSGDAMFKPVETAKAFGKKSPPEPREIIRYTFGKPLDFSPGEKMVYSNFGYCVLGRVIEQVTGQPYEKYVREEILAPLGIREMRIGKTLPAGRAAGEVHYDQPGAKGAAVLGEKLGQEVPTPYGAWYLEAMDAHGGWIASAVDLVRFAAAFDNPAKCPLLRPASIAAMLARPAGSAGFEADGRPKSTYYGCGWSVRPLGNSGRANTWHNGALDGTASLLVRRHDGLNWAVLFNTRTSPKGEYLGAMIDPLLHQAAGEVASWPDGNLFIQFSDR